MVSPRVRFTPVATAIFASLLLLSAVHGVSAQSQPQSQPDADNAGELLGDVQRSLQEEQAEHQQLDAKARKLASDLVNIRSRMVESASLIRNYEESMAGLEIRLADLEVLEKEKSAVLQRERADFARVLQALERLARFPPEAMIAQPNSPADTVRTAILLRSIVPEIERRAARLRYEIESLARAREQAAERRAELERARESLAKETASLDGLLEQKRQLKTRTEKDRAAAEARVAFLNKEASSLKDLVAKLEDERREREATIAPAPPKPDPDTATAQATQDQATQRVAAVATGEPITARQGQLPMPAVGTLTGRYGEPNANGVKLRGIRISTRPGAQVIAPHEGVAVYVGDFRGYGQLLIIEHAGGYHTLLAGMARIDSEMGQRIVSGEPVGIMGDGGLGDPVLYVELRRSGRPINPLPWMAARGTIPQG